MFHFTKPHYTAYFVAFFAFFTEHTLSTRYRGSSQGHRFEVRGCVFPSWGLGRLRQVFSAVLRFLSQRSRRTSSEDLWILGKQLFRCVVPVSLLWKVVAFSLVVLMESEV